MLTPAQNNIIYLMLLNGLLFLGLKFIARAIVFPGGPGSKQLGYVLMVAVALVLCITQQLELLLDLKFPPGAARAVLLGGFAAPVFLISLVVFRIKRTRQEKAPPPRAPRGDSNADH